MNASVETVTSELVIDLLSDADRLFARNSADFLAHHGYCVSAITNVLVQDLGIPLQTAVDLAQGSTRAIGR